MQLKLDIVIHAKNKARPNLIKYCTNGLVLVAHTLMEGTCHLDISCNCTKIN